MREAPGSGKVQAPVCPSLPSLASPSRGWVLLPAHPGAVEASGTRAAPGFSLPKSLPAPKIPSPFPCAALGSHTAGNARAGAGDSPGGASRSDLVRLSVRPSHPPPFPRPGNRLPPSPGKQHELGTLGLVSPCPSGTSKVAGCQPGAGFSPWIPRPLRSRETPPAGREKRDRIPRAASRCSRITSSPGTTFQLLSLRRSQRFPHPFPEPVPDPCLLLHHMTAAPGIRRRSGQLAPLKSRFSRARRDLGDARAMLGGPEGGNQH